VVEQVEELEGQSELTPFRVRDFCHLFRREVRVPVAGPPEFIAQSTDEVSPWCFSLLYLRELVHYFRPFESACVNSAGGA